MGVLRTVPDLVFFRGRFTKGPWEYHVGNVDCRNDVAGTGTIKFFEQNRNFSFFEIETSIFFGRNFD